MKRGVRFFQKGAALTEHALIIALLAIAAISAVQAISSRANESLNYVTLNLNQCEAADTCGSNIDQQPVVIFANGGGTDTSTLNSLPVDEQGLNNRSTEKKEPSKNESKKKHGMIIDKDSE